MGPYAVIEALDRNTVAALLSWQMTRNFERSILMLVLTASSAAEWQGGVMRCKTWASQKKLRAALPARPDPRVAQSA